MNPQPDYGRLVQCILNLKIHTRPEFITHEGTLVRTWGQAYQTLVDGLLRPVQDYNQLITFCVVMRHRLTEAVNNVIDDWSYLMTFVNHRLTNEAFEGVRQRFPHLFEEDELPINLLDNAQEMMQDAWQWRIQFQHMIDSLNIIEEPPPDKYEEDEGEEDEDDWAGLHPLDIELLRRPHRDQVGPILPGKYNLITWFENVRKFLYHVSAMLFIMHRFYDYTDEEVRWSGPNHLHFQRIYMGEFLRSTCMHMIKLKKPLYDTAEVFYYDYLKWFDRLRQVIETDPQNEQLIRLTHCMFVIVERRFDMAQDSRLFLDRLFVMCKGDYVQLLIRNLVILLKQLEEAIYEDPLDRNCRANLSKRAERRLSFGYEITDRNDFIQVYQLIAMMKQCYRNMIANLEYLKFIANRAKDEDIAKNILGNILARYNTFAPSELRPKDRFANVTLDQIMVDAQTVINQLNDHIYQLQHLLNDYTSPSPPLQYDSEESEESEDPEENWSMEGSHRTVSDQDQ